VQSISIISKIFIFRSTKFTCDITGKLFSLAIIEKCDKYHQFSEIIQFILEKYFVKSGVSIFTYSILSPSIFSMFSKFTSFQVAFFQEICNNFNFSS
jgi:hypothetical protein